MFDFKMCRMCFAMHCELHLIHNNRETYEAVTGLKLDETLRFPPYLCTHCHREIMKMDELKKETLQKRSVLNQLQQDHGFVCFETLAARRGNPSNSHVEHLQTVAQVGELDEASGRTPNDGHVEHTHTAVQVEKLDEASGKDNLEREEEESDLSADEELVDINHINDRAHLEQQK